MIHFIIGGARSGKTRFAENTAKEMTNHSNNSSHSPVFYIATSDAQYNAQDPEMQARVARHQADRPSHWQTIECPIYLAEQLKTIRTNSAKTNAIVMVDCLTLLCLNWLMSKNIQTAKQALIDELQHWQSSAQHQILLVSNEVGMGVVPIDAMSREFVDELGWLHQDVAQLADKVTLMTAGIATLIKSVNLTKEPVSS